MNFFDASLYLSKFPSINIAWGQSRLAVFSGMAVAIIQNSNYESVAEAKEAIYRYFDERNEYFLKHPQRAGNKIWGKEIVVPVFKEGQNCKNSRWR